MLFGVGIGTNHLATFGAFYDQALATIRMTCIVSDEQERSYVGKDGKVTFFLILPFNKQPMIFGNGAQVTFSAPDPESVRALHAAVSSIVVAFRSYPDHEIITLVIMAPMRVILMLTN